MRSSGPIEQGSIQEAILLAYWVQQRASDVYLALAQVMSPHDRKIAADAFKSYLDKHAPYLSSGTPQQTVDQMRSALDEWVKQDAIGIPLGPTTQPMMYSSSRAVRKFSRLKDKGSDVGRGRTPVPGRDRPKAGRERT